MITTIYIISGLYGPSVWDTGILSLFHVKDVAPFDRLPDFGLNESFMVFGGFGLAYNIFSSYMNVRKAMKACGKSRVKPLLFLLPFVFPATIQIIWLCHPEFNHSAIINSALFVPFLCAWGFQFAHQVGRMILAHVTSTPFPVVDWIWIWSIIGAADANLPRLIGRPPIFQSSTKGTAIFVYLTLAISVLAYGRFCTLVINDITNYLGIACFTVRKKGPDGVWRDTVAEAPASQQNVKRKGSN